MLHDQYGFVFDERYHKDLKYRVQTTMDIDRVIGNDYREIGCGFQNPFPRITIEPYGHRFLPIMYGCECGYAADSEPWNEPHCYSSEQIESFESWTWERFEQAEPVQEVVAQYRYFIKHYGEIIPTDRAFFNPHYQVGRSLQNLGSVINTAFSILGSEFFIHYIENPELVKSFYANITQLMLLCLRFFPQLDQQPLQNTFIGNCTVSMISPNQYLECNYFFDRQIMNYAQAIGATFMMHQDSDVTPHLENYARLEYISQLDVGQDTDFETIARLFPQASVNCILFPHWVYSTSGTDIKDELLHLMNIGRAFPSFSFSLYEIDSFLADKKIYEFYEIFRECALISSRK